MAVYTQRLKNKILNYSKKDFYDEDGRLNPERASEYLKVSNYKNISINELHEIMDRIPDNWLQWIKIQNNINIEKISNDIYGSPDFWDVLCILNYRNPLFEWPYDFDIVENMTDDMIIRYEKYVYKQKLSAKSKEKLRQQFYQQIMDQNERYREIKYIIPEKIYEFLVDLHKTVISHYQEDDE